MARFCGVVGFAETKKTAPGVWSEVFSEHTYFGDVVRNTGRMNNNEGLNDDIVVNNSFSIVADAYALRNFHQIRYINWMGSNWKVTTVEVQPPRLVLTIDGVYNV